MTPILFENRAQAGRLLATELSNYVGRGDVLVLALPRGGVPVGYEVARALGAPLDVLVVRKLGVPGYEELAMGALATGGACVLDRELIHNLRIPRALIDEVVAQERRELARRDREYRDDRPAARVSGRCVILVDDGLATGSTMRAAVAAVRRLGAGRVVVAVPVASPEARERLRREADEVVCVAAPMPFHAVGIWYEDFSQTTDAQVRELLGRAGGMAEPVTKSA